LRSTFHTPISKTLKESIDSKKRAEKMKRIFERKKEDKILFHQMYEEEEELL